LICKNIDTPIGMDLILYMDHFLSKSVVEAARQSKSFIDGMNHVSRRDFLDFSS
jgi:hypothetical protein